MKKTFNSLLPLTFLFIATGIFAQDEKDEKRERYEHFKERNISKIYPASGNTLHIDNKFGNVKFVTWERNEIKVDIHIEASSTDREFAEKSFARIDVKDRQDGKNIYFKTELDNKGVKNNNCKNCKSTLIIDYTVQLPTATSLNVENSFGSINIPDYKGTVSLSSKFGSLTAGTLTSPEKIVVEFGKANLKQLSNVDLDFKYSSIQISKLTGKCSLKLSFCTYSKINLDNSLTGLSVNDSYSSVHLEPATNLSASYLINTSFGRFIDKSEIEFTRTDSPSKFGSDLKQQYEGKSGSGNIKIDVKSSFGNIMIGQGTKEDMQHKKRVKS